MGTLLPAVISALGRPLSMKAAFRTRPIHSLSVRPSLKNYKYSDPISNKRTTRQISVGFSIRPIRVTRKVRYILCVAPMTLRLPVPFDSTLRSDSFPGRADMLT